jgi:hypothetical protein
MSTTGFTKLGLHKNLSQNTHINRLEFTAYELTASDHVDFFLSCRHPIRSAHIRQRFSHYNDDSAAIKFIINIAKVWYKLLYKNKILYKKMFKRLKQLDTGTLLHLPRTMDFNVWDSFYAYWDKDGHGTSITALKDAQPGLMRHVATLVDGEDQSVEFVVECADGSVNASITVNAKYYVIWHMGSISEILVKIAEVI